MLTMVVRHLSMTSRRFKQVTVITGYTLFALLVFQLVSNTVIPFSELFFTARLNRMNVLVLELSLIFGALAPIIISYILGTKVAEKKDHLIHHFNGMLLGIEAFWLSSFIAFFWDIEARPYILERYSYPYEAIFDAIPIAFVIIFNSFLVFYYSHHHGNKDSLLNDSLFQWTLGISLFGTYMSSFFAPFDWGSFFGSLVYIFVIVTAIIVSFFVFRKFSSFRHKMSMSLFVVSVGIMGGSLLTGGLLTYINQGYLVLPINIAFNLLVWIIFLYFLKKHTFIEALKKKKG